MTEDERRAYVAKKTGAFSQPAEAGALPPGEAPKVPPDPLAVAGIAIPIPDYSKEVVTLSEEAAIADAIARLGGKLSAANVRGLIVAECRELEALLLEKNEKYGNSSLAPKRIFSKLGPIEQLKVRIDDKISRISTGHGEDLDEDTIKDLLGYLILYRVARRLGLR